MAIRNTKLRTRIIDNARVNPGLTAKQISERCYCTLDTVYRLIKAGELVSIRRKLYHRTHIFTARQVQAMFPPRKFKPKPVTISGDPLATYILPDDNTEHVSDYELLLACRRN